MATRSTGFFFQESTEAVKNPVVVEIFGHDNAFNIMLDGGSKVADADTVGDETGKGRNDGLGSLNETEMVEICHKIIDLNVDNPREK